MESWPYKVFTNPMVNSREGQYRWEYLISDLITCIHKVDIMTIGPREYIQRNAICNSIITPKTH